MLNSPWDKHHKPKQMPSKWVNPLRALFGMAVILFAILLIFAFGARGEYRGSAGKPQVHLTPVLTKDTIVFQNQTSVPIMVVMIRHNEHEKKWAINIPSNGQCYFTGVEPGLYVVGWESLDVNVPFRSTMFVTISDGVLELAYQDRVSKTRNKTPEQLSGVSMEYFVIVVKTKGKRVGA